MAFNKARMYGEYYAPSAEEFAKGSKGPSRMNGKPDRPDGRARLAAGTDGEKTRGSAFDGSPSIVHWTKTT